MFNYKNFSSFTKNVLVVFRGTVISQLIVLLSTPILSRIFTPENFGVLSIFTSISTILGSIYTLKFELPIVLPRKRKYSIYLMILSIFFSIFFSIITLLIFIVWKDHIFGYFNLNQNSNLFLLVPCTTLFIGVSASIQQWFVRERKFNVLSNSNIIQSSSNSVVSLLLGIAGVYTSGLIFGQIVSYLFGIFYLIYTFYLDKNYNKFISKVDLERNLKNTFNSYVNYPKFMIVTTLLSVLSYQIIPIILQRLFSTEFVGYYSMANRLSLLPSVVIGSAIGRVFRAEVAFKANENEDIRPLFFATLKKMLVLGVSIYGLLAIIAPFLFSVFLGDSWKPAGDITRRLVIFIFAQFIVQTFYDILLVKSKLKIYMFLQLLLVITVILSIYVGSLIFVSPLNTITLMSVSVFFVLVFSLFMIYKTIEINKSACR